MKNLPPKFPRGFTIIQLAIILTVLAISLTAYLSLGAGKSQQRVFTDNQARIAYITKTISQFVINGNGYIPCPAWGKWAPGNANYGVADCTNTDHNATLRAGTIPFVTLGLDPARYYFDPYGNPYTYVIDKSFSTVSTFSSNTTGAITLNFPDGITTTNPAVLIISHGANGTGAFIPGSSNVVNNPMVTDAQELNNARSGGGWPSHGLSYSGNGQFYTAPPNIYVEQKSSGFDDVIATLTKQQITNPVGGSGQWWN